MKPDNNNHFFFLAFTHFAMLPKLMIGERRKNTRFLLEFSNAKKLVQTHRESLVREERFVGQQSNGEKRGHQLDNSENESAGIDIVPFARRKEKEIRVLQFLLDERGRHSLLHANRHVVSKHHITMMAWYLSRYLKKHVAIPKGSLISAFL